MANLYKLAQDHYIIDPSIEYNKKNKPKNKKSKKKEMM